MGRLEINVAKTDIGVAPVINPDNRGYIFSAEKNLLSSYMQLADVDYGCGTCNNCGSGDCNSCCGSTDD